MTQIISDTAFGAGRSNHHSPPVATLTGCPSFKGSQYAVVSVLGTGTYGQVYKCHDRSRNCMVAVKVAHREPAYRRSALAESRALQLLLGRRDAVQWLDTFEESGHVCIASELLAKNLYEHMKERDFSPLPLSEVWAVARSILGALAALHATGNIHCDVKPENIMLRSEAEGARSVALIDFGAVRALHENAYYDVQSLWYRAPEVLCGVPYTTKIDAWSVGCLLFELATGAPLFPGGSAGDQLGRIVAGVGSPSEDACRRAIAQGLLVAFTPGSTAVGCFGLTNRLRERHAHEPSVEAFGSLICGLLHPCEGQRLSCADAMAACFGMATPPTVLPMPMPLPLTPVMKHLPLAAPTPVWASGPHPNMSLCSTANLSASASHNDTFESFGLGTQHSGSFIVPNSGTPLRGSVAMAPSPVGHYHPPSAIVPPQMLQQGPLMLQHPMGGPTGYVPPPAMPPFPLALVPPAPLGMSPPFTDPAVLSASTSPLALHIAVPAFASAW